MRKIELLAGVALAAACGGGSNPPPNNPPTATSGAASASAAASAATSATPPAASAAASVAAPGDEHVDPNESAVHITMAPLVTKGAKVAYPKATAGDKECWQKVMLSGVHDKDFAALVASCGTPTGLVEYAKPVTGRLHHKVDKRDTFTLKLLGGMCYRYFAVADQGITDLDILIEKPNGALIADDKQTSPVAIVDGDKAWCMDEDAEYVFAIQVDGPGKGAYTFGVWAKPKGK